MNAPGGWGITGNLLAAADFPVYRFLPHKTIGEGFFLAVLRKPEAERQGGIVTSVNREVTACGAMNEKLSRKKTAAARNNSKPSSAPMGKEQIAVAKSWLLSPEDFEVSVNGSFITAFPKEYTGECSVLQRYLRIVQACLLYTSDAADE